MASRWRNMTTEERERDYSPSSCLPDGDYLPHVEAYRRLSDESWSRVAEEPGVATTTVSYGPSPSHTIDVVVPVVSTPKRPLLVFFHGGYWQELSKVDARFAAWQCVQRRWAFAAVDYTLAPDADLATIVDESRRAVHALHGESAQLGFDPTRVFVAGSSAGAHLAAMAALDPDGPPDRLAGAVLVSGIFELEPLIGTSINDALGLDAAAAGRNSPLRADVDGFPPTLLAFGENETSEFRAQTADFGDRLRGAGTAVTTLEVPGRHHFDVILDLAAPNTMLGDAVAALVDPDRTPD